MSFLAALKVFVMSPGEPQNCIDPFPKNLRELFRLALIDGLIDIFVDPCVVSMMDTPSVMDTWSDCMASMVIVSAVIARWINLVFVVWMLNAISVELRLHVEHTESMTSVLYNSVAAFHTNQPAHRPLISFPGLTVVAWVVMDIGSIHSMCSEKVSAATLTLMLLPLMTVLDTTGSMVHMVTLAFLVLHVTKGMNFRSCPSTTGVKPNASLNIPTRVSVKVSMDGTPLCLNKADNTSDADSGGSSDTAWNAIVCTSSLVLVSRSLSCSACSVVDLTLVVAVAVGSKFHTEYMLA
ncbi:hypothetical protein FALBO_13029 [Fusarium albosuccineum]|uniref:Uncharacterized protein n=1 Tax=Fusarium albosuccineum TaxID=1237068 RepID=A0A8H4P7G3_9HYPO|nr:hypothetical protein FALBO_13029 [Fusarium albosuccineum]